MGYPASGFASSLWRRSAASCSFFLLVRSLWPRSGPVLPGHPLRFVRAALCYGCEAICANGSATTASNLPLAPMHARPMRLPTPTR